MPESLTRAWGLVKAGSGLDSVSEEELVKRVFTIVKEVHPHFMSHLATSVNRAMPLFFRVHDEFILHRVTGSIPVSLTLRECYKARLPGVRILVMYRWPS